MNRPLTNLLLAILLSLVAACGWQLRGTPDLPPVMDVLYVESSDPYSPLARELKRLLGSGETQIVSSADDATAIVRILQSGSRQNVLSVNLEGRPEEIRVEYEMAFDVQTPEGETLIERQQLVITRDISADPSDPLGASLEAQRIAESLEESIAQSVLLRIEALANQPSFGQGVNTQTYAKAIRVDVEEEEGPVARELRRRIDNGEIELPWDDGTKQVTVRITTAGVSQEVLSVNDEGEPEELRLRKNVEYQLLDKDGSILIQSERIQINRTVTVDPDNPLSIDQQVRSTSRSMETEIVETIVQQLQGLRL